MEKYTILFELGFEFQNLTISDMRVVIFLVAICMMVTTYGQSNGVQHNYTIIQEAEWVIPHNDTLAFAFDTYDSSKALLLKRTIMDSKSASIAYPTNLDFRDGTIEVDIASPKGGAGYLGLAFR